MTALRKHAISDVTAFRLKLIEDGFRPVPCKGKLPAGFSGWQHSKATAENVAAWEDTHQENTNTGILTGDVVAIDVDILRPELAKQICDLVRGLPDGDRAPCRVGKPPKAMFLFRTNEPRKKSVTDWFKIDGANQRIEIMGAGQQVIVDGIHPDTGQPYTWPVPLKPCAELPNIDWPALETFLADAERLLAPFATASPRQSLASPTTTTPPIITFAASTRRHSTIWAHGCRH